MRYQGTEKRSVDRVHLTTFCPAAFSFEGELYSAMMIDLSEKGARFRFEEYTRQCPLTIGTTIECEVRTPYGKSNCKGRVVWAQHIDEHFTFGMAFTEISTDPKDPLLAFIDSVF